MTSQGSGHCTISFVVFFSWRTGFWVHCLHEREHFFFFVTSWPRLSRLSINTPEGICSLLMIDILCMYLQAL